MFNQQFAAQDLAVIGLLVILEGVLSIDNALVLGLLAKRLPKSQRARALTYGLVGAFVFRIVAIGSAQLLLEFNVVKLIGGGYLLYVAGKYFWDEYRGEAEEKITQGPDHDLMLVDAMSGEPLTAPQEEEELQARVPVPLPAKSDFRSEEASATVPATSDPPDAANPYPAPRVPGSANKDQTPSNPRVGSARFWPTVVVIELTDIAFAVDSILAAIALVGPKPAEVTGLHPKLWLVVTGGMVGVLLMRVAATIFIRLLERFPRFETSAYLLVLVIGAKLVVDWLFNKPGQQHGLMDFHSVGSPAFWVFWSLMLACFLFGFVPKPGHAKPAADHAP